MLIGSNFSLGGISSYFFIIYILNIINERATVSKIYYNLALIFCAISSIVDFIFSVNGKYFTVENGIYYEHEFVTFSSEMSILINVIAFIIAIRYFKVLGIHDFTAVFSYLIIPTVGTIVYSFFDISIEYAMMVISYLILFIMLQADAKNRASIRENDLLNQSRMDRMTGLLNRAAHDITIAEYKTIPRNFVYISLDLNGLKKANDNWGHSAGDELIIGAAQCILKCFGKYGNCFRVGGDEFACMLEIDSDNLKLVLKEFDNTVASWSGKIVNKLTISYGCAAIQDFCHVHQIGINELAKIADSRMYKCKEKYYLDTNQAPR